MFLVEPQRALELKVPTLPYTGRWTRWSSAVSNNFPLDKVLERQTHLVQSNCTGVTHVTHISKRRTATSWLTWYIVVSLWAQL